MQLRAAWLAFFLIAWTVLIGGARAFGGYDISAINPPDALSDTEVTSINNAGEISGYTIDWGVKSSAFVYQNGRFNVLTPGGGYYGFVVFDLNNNGDGIGWTAALYEGPHPVLWNRSTVKQLAPGIPVGLDPFAHGLNDSDTIVGSTIDPISLVQYPVEWKGGTMRRLTTLGGDGTATAINNAGVVVGGSGTDTGANRAVEWISGQIHTLGDLGGRFSGAYVINQNGVIAGESTTHSGATHAALWSNGTVTDLGPDGAVFAINDDNQVVGAYNGDGVMWANGQRMDLNALLPANSGWHLDYAKDINDSGQIIGEGEYRGQERAFEMTPVSGSSPAGNAIPLPDPATAGLLASPLLIFALRRSLRKQAAC